jgi:eukaryotic-like serine/threonine-protein kinase
MNPPAPTANPSSTDAPLPDPTLAAPTDATGALPSAFARQDYTGRTLGDFRFIRRLGEGGMGQVYLAEQLSLQRRVALKLLRPELLSNETFLKRFQAEAKAVAKLTHPHIVQVHAVGIDQGLHYMALEYVEGMNLKDYLHRKGPPELPIALTILRQVAAALVKSAELGIVHRDIKPENILITRNVEVKVTDFGLSRMAGEELHLTQTGTTMGTPLYMSPEQIMGGEVDPRSDLYSLGATCYHLFTGQPPFTGDTAMAVGLRHVSDSPTPLETLRPDLPAELVKLVHQLLAKKPEDRPQSPREVLRAVRRIQNSLEGATGSRLEDDEDEPLEMARPKSHLTISLPGHVSSPGAWRSWLWPIVLASVGVAIVGGSLIGFLLRGDAPAKPTATASPSVPVPSASSTSPPVKLRASRTDPRLPRPEPTRPARRNPLNAGLEEDLLKRIEATKNIDRQREPEFLPGLTARAELMRLYVMDLDEETLIKARRFARMEADRGPNEPYRAIGHLGLAAIYAYEEKPKESYLELDKAFALKDTAPRKPFLMQMLLRNRDLQDIVLVTVKANEKKADLPPEVKELRERIEQARRSANEKIRPGGKKE